MRIEESGGKGWTGRGRTGEFCFLMGIFYDKRIGAYHLRYCTGTMMFVCACVLVLMQAMVWVFHVV